MEFHFKPIWNISLHQRGEKSTQSYTSLQRTERMAVLKCTSSDRWFQQSLPPSRAPPHMRRKAHHRAGTRMAATGGGQAELVTCAAEGALLRRAQSSCPPFINNHGVLDPPTSNRNTVSVKESDFCSHPQNPRQSPPGQDGQRLNSSGGSSWSMRPTG